MKYFLAIIRKDLVVMTPFLIVKDPGGYFLFLVSLCNALL